MRGACVEKATPCCPISRALRVLVSVVVIVVIGTVAPWKTVQDCPDDICARLLQEPDRALDRGSRSLASPDNEANPIKMFRQQQGVAYGIHWRRIDDHAVVIAQEPLEKGGKCGIGKEHRRIGAMTSCGNEIQVLDVRWRDDLVEGCQFAQDSR